MKRIYFLLAIAATFLCSCKDNIIPKPIPGAQADFTYTVSGNLVLFRNASTDGLRAYMWDFGDDTFVMNTEQPSHNYSAIKTYTVTLTCKDKNGYTYKTTKSIVVGSSYSKAYIKGFKLYSIYAAISEYYVKFSCDGYDLWGEKAVNIETRWSANKLDNEDLPYTYILPSAVEIGENPNPFDAYDHFSITVYYAANTSASGVAVLQHTVSGYKLDGLFEYTCTVENGTKVGVLVEYK